MKQLIKLKLASGAEIADVEQMKKIVPFVTCEITFWSKCLRVCVCVNIPDLVVQINSVKQPIHSNSVGP